MFTAVIQENLSVVREMTTDKIIVRCNNIGNLQHRIHNHRLYLKVFLSKRVRINKETLKLLNNKSN